MPFFIETNDEKRVSGSVNEQIRRDDPGILHLISLHGLRILHLISLHGLR